MTLQLKQSTPATAWLHLPKGVRSRHYAMWLEGSCMIALVALNCLCFARALGCYFLADDLVPVNYLHEIFSGHASLLWEKLFSPWQDSGVQLLYRPFIELTMAADYAIWGACASGFHLSNLLYHISAVLLLFLIARQLLGSFGQKPGTLAAFFCAALFSVSPLNGETVVWIIGRVDSVCTAFYLLSFHLFLAYERRRSLHLLSLSVASFGIALLSKEMAVTLPLALSWYCLMLSSQKPLRQALSSSVRRCLPYWLLLVPYFLARTLVLGTPTGGYVGSIGEMCNSSLFCRWVESGTLWKVVYPFNEHLLAADSPPVTLLHLLYLAAGAVIMARAIWYPWNRQVLRLASFCLGWFLISLIPTYQVLYFNVALVGGRFLYLGLTALCLLVVLLLYPFPGDGAPVRRSPFFLAMLSEVVLLGFVGCLCWISIVDESAWLSASTLTLGLKDAVAKTLSTLPASRKIVIINLEKEKNGAHLFYSYKMLSSLLKPPLSDSDNACRVLSLRPTFYRCELLNISLLRRLIASGSCSFFCFDEQQLKLVSVPLKLPVAAGREDPALRVGAPQIQVDRRGRRLEYQVDFSLPVKTMAVDFVEVDLVSNHIEGTARPRPDDNVAAVSFPDESGLCFAEPRCLELPLCDDGAIYRYRFAVSQSKGWILSSTCRGICLSLPALNVKHRLLSVRLIDASNEIPLLAPDTTTVICNNDSTLSFAQAPGRFFFDASKVEGAQRVILEISRPKSCFEHYSSTLRETSLCARSLKRLVSSRVRGVFLLGQQDFPANGLYQIRLAAQSLDGRVLGYVSDPLSLTIIKH